MRQLIRKQIGVEKVGKRFVHRWFNRVRFSAIQHSIIPPVQINFQRALFNNQTRPSVKTATSVKVNLRSMIGLNFTFSASIS